MTNKNRKHEDDFFEVKCNGDSLHLPQFLYPDFERCIRCEAGLQVLSEIFDTYSKFPDEEKRIFQFSLYHFEDKIIDLADVKAMIIAFYKTYVIKD